MALGVYCTKEKDMAAKVSYGSNSGLAKVYLSLGSNIGDRETNLRNAIELLEQEVGQQAGCSSFFYSEPWGFESEHSFCNLCVCLQTALTAQEVLQRTQQVERRLGRTHKSVNRQYHDRIIDIDMLFYLTPAGKSLQIQTPTLTLPHPLMHLRPFVMIPLIEILKTSPSTSKGGDVAQRGHGGSIKSHIKDHIKSILR